MTAIPPLSFRYTDGKMVPRSRAQADRHYVEGELYALEEYHSRSIASHNHQFAALEDAWRNLPEHLAGQYRNPEIFRKRLLIQAGYCTEQQVVFTNSNDAIKAASLVLERDDYCVASATDNVLTIWTAKSQSMKAMGSKDFNESKAAILELAATMIGSDVTTLAAQHAAE